MKTLKKIQMFSFFAAFLFMLTSATAFAGEGGLDGAALPLWWGLPFAGILASLALMPLIATHWWHRNYGKVAFFWALSLIIPLWGTFGWSTSSYVVLATLFHEYFPFIILIGSLYAISGGVKIRLHSHGAPLVNTILLAVGTLLAGWIGTTGAAMLLIRPLININSWRTKNVHLVVFFIFLVGNIGGAVTPLGDPPLFLGFLQGVDFFWPLMYLLPETIVISGVLLAIFFVLDTFYVKKEEEVPPVCHEAFRMHIQGRVNFFFLAGVIGFVLLSGVWDAGEFTLFGIKMAVANVVRDGALILLTLASLKWTEREIRVLNAFSWDPLLEVVRLFFAIFITVIPVIAILNAGIEGELSGIVNMVSHQGQPVNSMYFWLTGILSAFLDNAPTYLVFFHLAGGDADTLMGSLSLTLEAISLASVFMGALTYIGNAPNFMVKAIAEERGVRMPSFFGYMAWSFGILLPLFLLLSWVHF